MQGDDNSYHQRRAEKQRGLAARCTDRAVANLHRKLAEMHDERAALPSGSLPLLRMVMPAG